MKKALKFITIVGVSSVLLAQFSRPSRENASTDTKLSIRASNTVPADVLATLEWSCFDCHSNETQWPWYSAITPVNILIANDVDKARKRLNFSEWKKQRAVKQQGLLQMIDDQVSLKDMPLPRYLRLHPNAALSEMDIKTISEWAVGEQERLSQLE